MAERVVHVYRQDGSYQAMLVVRDGHDAPDTAVAEVRVTNASPVIAVVAVPTTPVAVGAKASIQVVFSDPGALDSLTGAVDWGDGISSTIAMKNWIYTHVYSDVGSYYVSATVRDDEGAVATRLAASAIVVEPPHANHPPHAIISGPPTAREGAAVMFSAVGSTDPDGDTLSYQWITGDGRIFSGPYRESRQGWSYANDGEYTVSVVVGDRSGTADTASTKLRVINVPPVISAIPSPPQQAVGVPASVQVRSSDSGSVDRLTMTIRWGDGTSDSAPDDGISWTADSLTHTYSNVGSYQVSVIVRDDGGAADTATANAPVLVFDPAKRAFVAGYEVLDLGTLGGNTARPSDFNDFGKVVGSSRTASGATHAFVWENGVMRDLGTMGYEESEAERVNNKGVIAGSVWTGRHEDCSHGYIATIWRNGAGTVLDSKTAVGYPVHATAMNESDDITWSACGHENDYAWLWQNNRWYSLGTLLGPFGPATAGAMNEHGQIVGTADAVLTGEHPGANPHAFLWESGSMRDLGLLGFDPCPSDPTKDCGYATATSINENGQVAGFSTAADGALHVVLWDDGRVRDLWKVPPNSYPMRVLINDAGQVVWSAGGEGFFWSDGTTYPLGSLGGGSTSVADLNESGAIAGTSLTTSREQHAFVWTRERGMIDLGSGPQGFGYAWIVGISYYGDIAGFAARCAGYANGCGPYGDVRAILWRRANPETATRR